MIKRFFPTALFPILIVVLSACGTSVSQNNEITGTGERSRYEQVRPDAAEHK